MSEYTDKIERESVWCYDADFKPQIPVMILDESGYNPHFHEGVYFLSNDKRYYIIYSLKSRFDEWGLSIRLQDFSLSDPVMIRSLYLTGCNVGGYNNTDHLNTTHVDIETTSDLIIATIIEKGFDPYALYRFKHNIVVNKES